MLFWLIAALMTLTACLAVLVPLVRRPPAGAPDTERGHDLEVYRDQLDEVGRDEGRGLIGRAEAEEARAEISRRILRLTAGDAGEAAARSPMMPRLTGMTAVLAVPAIAWGLYAALGSPGLPGEPLAQRLAKSPADSSIQELVGRAEAHLAANPADGRGWDVLAPIYLRLGREGDAVRAYQNAIRLNGASAERESGLGEAMAYEAGGIVSAEATEAFARALTLDPGQAKARFYLASALVQEGRLAEAAGAWRALAASLPAGSPWQSPVAEALAGTEARLSAGQSAPARGPGQAEIEAAAALSDEDRAAMVETMVAELDGRLRQKPDDGEGWRRLVRSYHVLGRGDDARAALSRGLAALGPASDEGKALAALATELGIEGAEAR